MKNICIYSYRSHLFRANFERLAINILIMKNKKTTKNSNFLLRKKYFFFENELSFFFFFTNLIKILFHMEMQVNYNF